LFVRWTLVIIRYPWLWTILLQLLGFSYFSKDWNTWLRLNFDTFFSSLNSYLGRLLLNNLISVFLSHQYEFCSCWSSLTARMRHCVWSVLILHCRGSDREGRWEFNKTSFGQIKEQRSLERVTVKLGLLAVH
jgi:hypothetical protein